MAGLLNTNGGAAAHEFVIPLESSTRAFQALPDFRKTVENVRQVNPELTLRGIFQERHLPIVEDEQDERYALRALLEVWEHRVEEAENGARGIELALDRRPERGMTSLLRAGLGLLAVPLVVAGYAGLTALILPLVALRSVFGRRGRPQRLLNLAERVLPARPAWPKSRRQTQQGWPWSREASVTRWPSFSKKRNAAAGGTSGDAERCGG